MNRYTQNGPAKKILAAFAILIAIALVADFYSQQAKVADYSSELKPTCSDSLQSQIDGAAAGSTIMVRTDCIYREELSITKEINLDGQGGAEIRGSDVWTDWTQVGSTWVSTQSVPTFGTHGSCASTSNGRCRWAEQVFLDGNGLFQQAAESTPASGEFALNASRQVVIADNPTGKVVEVTIRRRWAIIEADNVVVNGFTMKHSSVDSQSGAIQARNNVENVVIKNNSLSDAHGAVVGFDNVDSGQLLNNDIYNGGQLGINASYTTNLLIDGNLIHHNNTEQFSTGWEAGALKIVRSTDSVFSNNESSFNAGPGYWCDIDCYNATVSNNLIHDNTSVGIFFEISDTASIYGNKVWENKWNAGGRTWVTEAGIIIASSKNAEVYDNIVAWHGDGIVVMSQCRATHEDETCNTTHRWNNVEGNYVHDNIIIMEDDPRADYNVHPLAWSRDIKDEQGDSYNYMYSPEANNRGSTNGYWIPQPEGSTKIRFAWNNSTIQSLEAFNATPGEEDGYYLNDTEKNTILSSNGMPTSSADHTNPIPTPTPINSGTYSSPMPTPVPTPTPTPEPTPTPTPEPTPYCRALLQIAPPIIPKHRPSQHKR